MPTSASYLSTVRGSISVRRAGGTLVLLGSYAKPGLSCGLLLRVRRFSAPAERVVANEPSRVERVDVERHSGCRTSRLRAASLPPPGSDRRGVTSIVQRVWVIRLLDAKRIREPVDAEPLLRRKPDQ